MELEIEIGDWYLGLVDLNWALKLRIGYWD